MGALTYLETDGGKLAVEIVGSGPLVITSPGMGESRDCYAEYADILVQKGYSVAMMDYRGAGDSSVLFTRYGDDATSDDLILAALRLAPNKSVILAGTSFSAAAAVIAAGKRPDIVSGIILLGPFIRNPGGIAGKIGKTLMPAMFGGFWGPSVWQSYAKTLYPGLGEQAAERAAKSKASLTRDQFRWKAFQFLVKSLDHSETEPWISKVTAPVLVIMGEKDPDWKDPRAEADFISTQFKDVTIKMAEGVGHCPQLEASQLTASATLDFFQKLQY